MLIYLDRGSVGPQENVKSGPIRLSVVTDHCVEEISSCNSGTVWKTGCIAGVQRNGVRTILKAAVDEHNVYARDSRITDNNQPVSVARRPVKTYRPIRNVTASVEEYKDISIK